MKWVKIVAAAVGIFVGFSLSSQAAILLPGDFGLDPPQEQGPEPLATLVSDYDSGNLNGFITSLVVMDPANPLGGLSFYYKIGNIGEELFSRFTISGFGIVPGAPVEVSTIAFPLNGLAPFIAERSSGAGNIVGFDFTAPPPNSPDTSRILVVNTPFQSFGEVAGSIIGNQSVDVTLLGPAISDTVVPEPSTLIAGSLLLLPFVASALRPRGKACWTTTTKVFAFFSLSHPTGRGLG